MTTRDYELSVWVKTRQDPHAGRRTWRLAMAVPLDLELLYPEMLGVNPRNPVSTVGRLCGATAPESVILVRNESKNVAGLAVKDATY